MLSLLSGVMVKKSIPNLAIRSTRRAGLSHFPAYLIAVVRASINSAAVKPRPSTIFRETNAAMSPARSIKGEKLT